MKKLFFAAIMIHLTLIMAINICGTANTIHDFYYGFSNTYQKNSTLKLAERITNSSPVWAYASYAGINATYGFYAPNVGSEFLMSFSVLDDKGHVLGQSRFPDLHQKESKHRFSLCTAIMQEKIGRTDSNPELNNYFKVMLHQIAMNIKSGYKNAAQVSTSVFLYEYPKIHAFAIGERDKLILVEKYAF